MKTEYIIIKDTEFNEFVVQCIEDGVVNKLKSYNTDNYDDACATLISMQYQTNVNQHCRLDQMGDKLNIPKLKGKKL